MPDIITPASVESLHRNYAVSEEWLSQRENRDERNHALFGVTITSSLSPSPLSAFGKRGRYVTMPAHPTLFQKVISFLLVQGRVVEFAKRENQWSGYAFSWVNALDIFLS